MTSVSGRCRVRARPDLSQRLVAEVFATVCPVFARGERTLACGFLYPRTVVNVPDRSLGAVSLRLVVAVSPAWQSDCDLRGWQRERHIAIREP